MRSLFFAFGFLKWQRQCKVARANRAGGQLYTYFSTFNGDRHRLHGWSGAFDLDRFLVLRRLEVLSQVLQFLVLLAAPFGWWTSAAVMDRRLLGFRRLKSTSDCRGGGRTSDERTRGASDTAGVRKRFCSFYHSPKYCSTVTQISNRLILHVRRAFKTNTISCKKLKIANLGRRHRVTITQVPPHSHHPLRHSRHLDQNKQPCY